jgi:hypothetical protein
VSQEPCKDLPQLSHVAYTALTEEYIRRGTGKAFTGGVENFEIEIRLLLGGEKAITRL